MKLQPYPAYINSGVEWLGQIPAHWEVRRLKHLLYEVNLRCEDEAGQLLSVSQYTGVTPRKLNGEFNTRASSLIGYKTVEVNDLAVNIMLAWNGSMGVSRYEGVVSPAYCVYRFRQSANPWYYHDMLRQPIYKGRIKTASTGVVESRLRLYSDDLFRIEALLPPCDEQDAIVHFVEHTDRRVNRLIKAKRRLIELLHEQKQAVIHRAVTMGLDPDAPRKPSGVDWLGDIPAHWQVLRTKFIVREVDNRSLTGEEAHLSMSQKLGLVPQSALEERRLISDSYIGAKLCQPNDIVLNRLKAHLGVFALANQTGLVSPDYTVFRPTGECCVRYFERVLRTPACRVELRNRAKGIVQGFWRLYTDEFYRIFLPVPPLNEQRQITEYLNVELGGIERTINKVQREIELIREYRTRLIADVVTGKIDVRGAAFPVSDTAAEWESMEPDDEDADALDEAEEATDEGATG